MCPTTQTSTFPFSTLLNKTFFSTFCIPVRLVLTLADELWGFHFKGCSKVSREAESKIVWWVLGGKKHRNEVTVHGQVNELSPMWSCWYLTPINARIRGFGVLEPHDPIVRVRRMKGLEPQIRRVSVPSNGEQTGIFVTNPRNLKNGKIFCFLAFSFGGHFYDSLSTQ